MLRPIIDPRPPADIIDFKTRLRFDPSGRAPNSHPLHRHIENLHERVDALEARCSEMEAAIRCVADDVTKLADLGHRTDSASCVSRADALWRLGSRILAALNNRAPAATHTGGAA